jgi:hypothetical protein
MFKALKSGLTGGIAALLVLVIGMSTAWAGQLTLSYVDANGAQTLTVDKDSSNADLALAASLLGEDGVGLVHDADNGSGTLAEIAGALAAASPVHGAAIARVLSQLSPDDTDAIVAAVNAVSGVNNNAVLAAVNFGLPGGGRYGPQTPSTDTAIGPELGIIDDEDDTSPN